MALLAQPGTTLMRPACNARMPARTAGAACIITSFNAGVSFCSAAAANPVSDIAPHYKPPEVPLSARFLGHAQIAAARGQEAEVLAAYRLAVLRATDDVENALPSP
jgi:hypothetical protein